MKKYFVLLLAWVLLALSSQSVFANTAIDNGLQYLRTQQQTDGHIDGFDGVSDWAAQAFAANGIDIKTVTNTSVSLRDYLS